MAYSLDRHVKGNGRLEVFEFKLSEQSKDIARSLREAGLPITAIQLNKSATDLGNFMVQKLAEAAAETLSDYAPIDTGELALDHVQIDASPGLSIVYVDTQDHYGSRRKQPEKASSLAEYLNNPDRPLTRSQESLGGISGPTKDWVTDAQLNFQQRKKDILRGLI